MVAWPRSLSFGHDATGTEYPAFLPLLPGTQGGGDQFDLSSLGVRTMFLFLKEYFKLSSPIFL